MILSVFYEAKIGIPTITANPELAETAQGLKRHYGFIKCKKKISKPGLITVYRLTGR
jgi:hypothetical protein